jgi:hypothetical protein
VFNFLRKFFGGKPFTPNQSATSQVALRDMNIFVFAEMQEDGIDASDLTQENLLEQIRKSVEEMSKRQSFAPFIYESNGHRRLPFFSSNDYAQAFATEYSKQRHRVYPFQLLEVKGSVFFDLLPVCDVLVLNDGSPDAVEISVSPQN